MAATWSQYPNYGSYQAQAPYPAQAPQANQGGYPAQVYHQAQGVYAAHGGYPTQANDYYAGGNYTAQGAYSQQPPQQQQQYNHSYYPQQQYDSGQANYSQLQYQNYGQQAYPQQVPQQPTFQPFPQYQQPQPVQQHQMQPAPQPQPSQQPAQQPPDAKNKAARPSLNTCYNCGSIDHWAMNCPEPKRANPHGAMMERKNQQQQKHQPIVITRYPVPPHIAAQHSTPTPGFTNSNPTGPYYQTVQANQYPQQRWQGAQPHTPHTPSSYQANQFPGYGQQQHGLPTPRNSLSYPSNSQSSPTTPNKPGQPYGPSNTQSPDFPTPPASLPSTSQAVQPGSHAQHSSVTSSRRPSMDQSVSMQSASDVDEDEELQLLDVPDFPKDYTSDSYPKPLRVGKPIRALDAVNSTIGSPVHEVPKESNESVVSKYLKAMQTDDLLINVSHTDNFAEWKQDPIFAAIETGPYESLAQKNSPSLSTESDRLLSSTAQANTSSMANLSTEEEGNKTPVYRQEPGSSPRARDAFDLDQDDLYHAESKPLPLPVQVPGQLPGLDYASHPPPPPPPPPPMWKSSGYTNGFGQHVSPGRNTTRAPGHFSNGTGRNGSYNGPQTSPRAYSSDRKRKVEATDFMESPDRDRKRQEEDYIPKHKRNQPKVAEAYSRRW